MGDAQLNGDVEESSNQECVIPLLAMKSVLPQINS